MTPLPITCKCGFKFCFDCGDKVHVPVPCKLLKLWRQSDNEETMDWLIKSTKPCPNCSTAIEKNGGCNHMVHIQLGACRNDTIANQNRFSLSYRAAVSVVTSSVGCVLVPGNRILSTSAACAIVLSTKALLATKPRKS